MFKFNQRRQWQAYVVGMVSSLAMLSIACISESQGRNTNSDVSFFYANNSGCPQDLPQNNSVCNKHGLTCTYDAVTCANGQKYKPVATCIHGLFSIPNAPAGCPVPDTTTATTDTSNPCSANIPADGASCDSEGLHCFYGTVNCPAGKRFDKVAKCQNGQIAIETVGCS